MKHPARRNVSRSSLPALFNQFWNNDFFNNFFDGDVPAVNVKENKNNFKVEVSAPGFDKEDFGLRVDKNILTISAKKEIKNEDRDNEERLLRQEFSSSSFSRSFTLPENVDTEKINATQNNGILEITLPKMDKAPEDTIKKIEIK